MSARAAVAGRLAGLGRAASGWLAGAAEDAAALALPARCGHCGAAVAGGAPLCAPCRAAIPSLPVALCVACLARGRDPSACAVHAGRRARAAWLYDARAAHVVHAFKFGGRPDLAGALADALAAALPSGPRPDLVVPVPLHAARRRERGYDQAERLATALATRVGAPCVPGVLRRARATAPQSRLGAAARRANVAGAFAVARPAWVRGRRVLVVDDVVTTGATLEACLEALEAAGAAAEGAAVAWAQ